MKIGIFDSGMGGLSVLHRALRMIPEADFLYYADEEHVPYGEKTRQKSVTTADGGHGTGREKSSRRIC